MNVSLDLPVPNTTQAHAAFALLCYRSPQLTLVTRHTLSMHAGQLTLGEGVVVTTQALAVMNEALQVSPLQYYSEEVIARSRTHVAWWEPARERRMAFSVQAGSDAELLHGRTLPHPPLLFIGGQGRLRVYALPQNARPTLETRLHAAPYWNVFDQQQTMCTGNVRLPATVEHTAPWSEAFFGSAFSHPSGTTRRHRERRSYVQTWLDAEAAGQYDPAWLPDIGVTVKEALACG
ncbi:PRTRC system protein B [Deinococcus sonorensis]|uniref:PRTRC system protein B n=1 Tax=Deinococcus sonorensis TaxID=309891 RepID=A0ABV8YB39_9DEIO